MNGTITGSEAPGQCGERLQEVHWPTSEFRRRRVETTTRRHLPECRGSQPTGISCSVPQTPAHMAALEREGLEMPAGARRLPQTPAQMAALEKEGLETPAGARRLEGHSQWRKDP